MEALPVLAPVERAQLGAPPGIVRAAPPGTTEGSALPLGEAPRNPAGSWSSGSEHRSIGPQACWRGRARPDRTLPKPPPSARTGPGEFLSKSGGWLSVIATEIGLSALQAITSRADTLQTFRSRECQIDRNSTEQKPNKELCLESRRSKPTCL
jgi:hypothetical protein